MNYSDEQLTAAVTANHSIAGVARAIGIVPRGGNYRTIKKHIARLGLDTSHFTGQAWSAGLNITPSIPARSLGDILVDGIDYQSDRLRRRLISEGVKLHQCESCGETSWLGLPIPLELDHVNGVHTDNRIENLRILCPNCHALTPTYRGKNVGRT